MLTFLQQFWLLSSNLVCDSFCSSCLEVNRRLDEWVKLEQLDLASVEAVVDEKVEDKVMIIFRLSCFSF